MSLETFSYGDHALQTITVADLHPAQPLNDADTGIGTNTGTNARYWVILIHGGAWRDPTQTSESYLTPALEILRKTSSTTSPLPISRLASISYRLSAHPSHPQDPSTEPTNTLRAAKHPDHLADIHAALAFLQAKYKFGSNYVLVGHSCGATLAFQAVMRGISSGKECAAPTGILGMAGIYDLRLLRDSHRDISAYQEFIEGAFGDDETLWDSVSPAVVEGKEGVLGWEEGRAVVLAHSEEDGLCDLAQSLKMKETLGAWEKSGNERREIHFLSIKGEHDEAWEKGEELARGIVYTFEKLQDLNV
ncbi:alpha/beta-hydrolase [Aspergillus pseudodeflectus]|uniref:Kynurenine formamidase n=1 Tax=Aspergillus pseudodeflectus TaxID=176178 RepID=A0ABR4L1L4_9EURO